MYRSWRISASIQTYCQIQRCVKADCLSGARKLGFLMWPVVYLFLMVWVLLGHTAASQIKSPITPNPIELNFSTGQHRRLFCARVIQSAAVFGAHCQSFIPHSYSCCPVTLSLAPHKTLSISRLYNNVNISCWQDAERT